MQISEHAVLMFEGTLSAKIKNIIVTKDSVRVTRCCSCVRIGGESFLSLEDGGSVFLKDVCTYLSSCTLSRTWNVVRLLIILKWNKIYTWSNTAILYFIGLIKYKIVVFDEVYVLFRFNIILKHNGMSSIKIKIKIKIKIYWLFSITER